MDRVLRESLSRSRGSILQVLGFSYGFANLTPSVMRFPSNHSMEQSKRVDLILSDASRVGPYLRRGILALYRSLVPELLVALFGSILFFGNAIRYQMPIGYAGLYSSMIDRLVANNFQIPDTIPYYGPGGIPFAYPPLAFYVGGLFVGLFHISIFEYLRYAPAVFGMLSLGALYFLSRTILSSRPKALIGTLLFATINVNYTAHITAAGVVRGLAMTLMLVGLAISWRAIRGSQSSRKILVLAGLCFALTAATHLSYAVVFILGTAAFVITAGRHQVLRSLGSCILILLVGVILAAPWWLTMVLRHGLDVFIFAFNSHGTLGILSPAMAKPVEFVFFLFRPWLQIGSDWIPAPTFGLILLGIGYSLMQKRWVLPIWFFLVLDLSGESDRFLAAIGSMMAADFIADIATWTRELNSKESVVPSWQEAVLVLTILGVCLGQGISMVRKIKPDLSPTIVETGNWFQFSTPPDATYAFATDDHDLAEWLPYLTRRTPLVAYWGAEWTGGYGYRYDLFWRMAGCSTLQSYTCLTGIFHEIGRLPDYLIVHSQSKSLAGALLATTTWRIVHEDDALIVFHRND